MTGGTKTIFTLSRKMNDILAYFYMKSRNNCSVVKGKFVGLNLDCLHAPTRKPRLKMSEI